MLKIFYAKSADACVDVESKPETFHLSTDLHNLLRYFVMHFAFYECLLTKQNRCSTLRKYNHPMQSESYFISIISLVFTS
jgi:hypothetical protein